MTVHSEMMYSRDDGNKRKALFHTGPSSAADFCHWQLQPELVLAVSGPLPSHFQSGVISSLPSRRDAGGSQLAAPWMSDR